MENWLELVFTFIPQMGGAVLFFWLCQVNADKQRQAYQKQIETLYDMIGTMLSNQARMMDGVEKMMEFAKVNQG